MKGFGNQIKVNKKQKKSDKKTKVSQEQIINQAFRFHSQGNIKEAAKLYQYCINQGFNDQMVLSNYGIILSNIGKFQEAELYTRKAIQLNPNFANAHSNLGFILRNIGKFQEAELYTRKAIQLNPSLAQAHLNLGNILGDIGKFQEAELSFRKAIELNPGSADAYFNLFSQHEKINNLDKLQESLKEFNKIDKIKNELLLFRSRLSFRNKKYKTSKELIDNISSEWVEKLNRTHNRTFWSYKAFIEDKVGNYDIAYSCFEKSQNNSLYMSFNKDLFLNLIISYKESIINKKTIPHKFNDGIEDSNLAFLVGFPRSGTTLLDTILRSHPDIEVIEEQPILFTIENLVETKFNTKINNLYSISDNTLRILRKQYFELLKKYTKTKGKLIIDKMPLHTSRLPLINLLFPNAKIIFTHRHPYDTVLSCFQQSFKPNSAMANLVSLKSSSIMYDQVMSAWNKYKHNLPLDFITSKYENLIEDFDAHTLKILNFLGVGWNKNVQNYRKTAKERGRIDTPSSSQVVQPLYKSSIEKWKNYEKYFQDCHQYLEKWVSYFDY